MRPFPASLAQAARKAGLGLHPFDWTMHRTSADEAITGTAVVGDLERLQWFLRQFIAPHLREGLRVFTPTPEPQTAESVIYFPNCYIGDE